MSAEHRALGFRPPAGSLAAAAQRAAARATQASGAAASGGDDNRQPTNGAGAGPGSEKNTKRRRSSASSATTAPTGTSPTARTRQLSGQNGAGSGKRRGSAGSSVRGAAPIAGAKDKDGSKDDVLRAAALRDAVRIQYVSLSCMMHPLPNA